MAHRADSGFPRGGRAAWRATVPLAGVLARLWVRHQRRGEAVPDGPVVVAANHFSHVDPVIVSVAVRRPVRFLAVDELFGSSRFFDRLTHWLGAIPLSRTRVPLGALRTALAELNAGGVVGVFPEGLRVWRWGEVSPKRGAAWLAWRAGVPLVPVAITGTDLVMGRGASGISRGHVTSTVCPPIDPREIDGVDPVDRMTRLWVERIDGAIRSVR